MTNILRRKTLKTVFSQHFSGINVDANEIVAEKQTSRPFNLLLPSTKSLSNLKVGKLGWN